MFLAGYRGVIKFLRAYNTQDTVTSKNFMVTVNNMKLRQMPLYQTHLIEEPTLPVNAFRADLATVVGIKNSSPYW